MLNRRQITHQPMATPQQVLRFVADAKNGGIEAALVVLAGKTNGGPRAPGALMAVLETGARAGSLSSGCVEAAIAGEALDALARGEARRVQFGEGSNYVDIRLPCGAGMDLLFIPNPGARTVTQAIESLDNRVPVTLTFGNDGSVGFSDVGPSSASAHHAIAVRYTPDLRMIVAGHGAEAEALVRQAVAFGAIVELLTPDEELLQNAIRNGVSARFLEHIERTPEIDVDPWTAIAILFHDHDWEPALVETALRSNAFWIGAMGSNRTAERRRALLGQLGFAAAEIERIKGPVGTISGARDPSTLALSTLAQIVADFGAAAA